MTFTRKTLGIGLIVSVAVNLFLAGFIVASVALHDRRGFRPPPRGGVHLRAAFRTLDEDSRGKAMAIWREKRPEIRTKIRAIRDAHRDFRAAVRASDGDPAKLETAFEKIHAARTEARRAIHRAIAELVASLKPDERAKFLQAVYERRRRGRRWRGRDRDRGDRDRGDRDRGDDRRPARQSEPPGARQPAPKQ